jgi:hypothetical protein
MEQRIMAACGVLLAGLSLTLSASATESVKTEEAKMKNQWVSEHLVGDNATHTYERAGSYKVRLTVHDEQGRRRTASVDVTVLPADTVAPTLTAVAAPGRSDRVLATFSEPVQRADAQCR